MLDNLVNKGLLRTPENILLIDQMLKKWHSSNANGPNLHIIVLTRRCNLQCTYCHASAKPVSSVGQDLSIDTAKEIVDFIVTTPSNDIKIEFQGGEALLNWEVLVEVVEYGKHLSHICGKKITFCLTTNATLLSKEKIEFLRDNCVSVCSSLDGPSWIHDIYRHSNGKGTFDLVARNIELANNLGVNIPFLTVLTRQSYSNYRTIVDFYLEHNANMLCLNPVKPLGLAKSQWDQLGYDCTTEIQYYRLMLDYMFEKIRSGQFILERMFNLALNKITSSSDVTFTDFRNPCGAVFGQIVYDIDGVIYPCDEARGFKELALGTVRSHSFEDIAHSHLAMTIRDASIPQAKECMVCAYKPSGTFTIDPSENRNCQVNLFLFDYLFNKIVCEPEDIKLILKIKMVENAFSEAAMRNNGVTV
jgi:radical SAM protein with 4Fe4S-binding SPASM domain